VLQNFPIVTRIGTVCEYSTYINNRETIPLCVAVVAVLQFQNMLYESQKLTLYLYINIEVFLGYGNSLERTATLQHCNSESKNIAEK